MVALIYRIIGRPEIGTRLALRNSTQVLAKKRSHSAAQEQPSNPERRLVDFDEPVESIEEKMNLPLS